MTTPDPVLAAHPTPWTVQVANEYGDPMIVDAEGCEVLECSEVGCTIFDIIAAAVNAYTRPPSGDDAVGRRETTVLREQGMCGAVGANGAGVESACILDLGHTERHGWDDDVEGRALLRQVLDAVAPCVVGWTGAEPQWVKPLAALVNPLQRALGIPETDIDGKPRDAN